VTKIPVPLTAHPYEVFIGKGLLTEIGEYTTPIVAPCRCVVITDENVAAYHAGILMESLGRSGFDPQLLVIPAGEQSKSMSEASKLCDRMIELGIDRKGAVFALGGGVIGDLAGFVASIFYRGIPVIQIPTTVISQIDSSVGGKTGVNSHLGKNLIGSFHQPLLVIADTATLSSLPERIFREGLAEAIKHAVIADASLLSILPTDSTKDLTPLIARNVAIKASIVAADEFETKGTRALLNFGHTIGHAVESVAGYGVLSHGEAVAIGMIAALDLSVRLAGLPIAQAEQVLETIMSCGLPHKLPSSLSTELLLAALQRDKKFDRGAVRFVLTSQLGSAQVSDKVTIQDLTQSIDRLRP
jgi:3-dehydroquinate synthase